MNSSSDNVIRCEHNVTTTTHQENLSIRRINVQTMW